MKAFLSSDVRQMEQNWALSHDGSTFPLMEQAGQAAFDCVLANWPDAQNIGIFVGTGNNGGDGYVLARLLQQAGRQVTVVYTGDPGKDSDAQKAQQQFLKAGGTCAMYFPDLHEPFDLLVDALLGTGMKGDLRANYLPYIHYINHRQAPVLALDVPSGMDSDSGFCSAQCVQADLTLTFIRYKPGMLSGPARALCGRLQLETLAVNKEAGEGFPLINGLGCAQQYQRSLAAHKGQFGACMIVAGSPGMGGAAVLAALASSRMGGGWTMVRTAADIIPVIMQSNPGIMPAVWNEGEVLPDKVKAVVLGPGLGREPAAEQKIESVLEQVQKRHLPLVMDADALFWLARQNCRYPDWVLTPHDGEAAHLLGVSTEDIAADRCHHAMAISRKYGGICVLKGAGTVISDGRHCCINLSGTPAMAKAGSGDVLAGMLGTLLGRSSSGDRLDRVCDGVWMHGRAGELAERRLHREFIQASDLIDSLAEVWREVLP